MASLETFSEVTLDSPRKNSSFKVQKIQITKIPNYFRAKKAQNVLVLVAFTIGLGSMWRFPYLCHQNGGGSFLLLYIVMLLLLGIPLLYIELVIGQWLRMENLQVWKKLVPFLGGVGYASILATILVSLYNSILVSWSIFYLGSSFYHPLPWTYCPVVGNATANDLRCFLTVPHQYFWYHTMLRISDQVEEGVEVIVLKLSLCLLAAWTFLCLTMVVRIKISMPMLIFSIFLSTILLLCFFIRGLFLEGAMASLRRLLTTELSTLASLDIWRQAGTHVLYSLGLGLGTIVTFSSYQAGDDDYIIVASFLALVNLVTSVLTTSTIFLILGFWATSSGSTCVEKSVLSMLQLISRNMLSKEARPPENIALKPPQDFVNWVSHLPKHLQSSVIRLSLPCSIVAQTEKIMESPGLAYVAFSQAISLLPGSSFWAIIFFMTLVILGLGTIMTLLEGVVLPLQSSIPPFVKYPRLVPVLICLGGFTGSLIFTSHSGSYVLFLFDDHLIPMVLAVIVAFQNVALVWIYGVRRVKEEMYSQLGCLLWTPFAFLWNYLSLPILLFLLGMCFMHLYHKAAPYYIAWNNSASQEVKQPYLKTTLDWVTFLSTLALLPIPIYPLQHWWYLEDPVIPAFLNKTRKTMELSHWPSHSLGRSADQDQAEGNDPASEDSLAGIKSSRVAPLTPLSPPSRHLGRDKSFSLFSLPQLDSFFALSNSSFLASRRANQASEEVGPQEQA